MTDNIRLENRDGQWVGVDPDTGTIIPIQFGSDVVVEGDITGDSVTFDDVTAASVLSPEVPRIPTAIDGMDNPFSFSNEIPEIAIPAADWVEIKFTTLQGNADPLKLQFSDDGGDTWAALEDYDYSYEQQDADGVDNSASALNQTAMEIAPRLDASGGRASRPLTVTLPEPTTNRPQISWHGNLPGGGEFAGRVYGGGTYKNTIDVDRLRLYTDSGSEDGLDLCEGLIVVYPGGTI